MSDPLNIYTVYFNPKDHPGKYVMRRFEYEAPTQDVWVADTLEEVRRFLPLGLWPFAPDPSDQPHIVEIWL